MPQLLPQFYSSQLVWLTITFVLLFVVMWKIALPRVSAILTTRQERMEQDLERATSLKSEADEVMDAYQSELNASRATALEALKAVQEKAADEAAARNSELEATLATELTKAEARIAESRESALASIGAIATELAGAAVEKLTGEAASAATMDAAVKSVEGSQA